MLHNLPATQQSRLRVTKRLAWSPPIIRQARRLPVPQARCLRPNGDLVAHYGHRNLPPMRRAAMLEKEDTLPRAELHSPIHNRNGFACPG